jgi:hypothetical protein
MTITEALLVLPFTIFCTPFGWVWMAYTFLGPLGGKP